MKFWSITSHCDFFMGLQRKQGVPIQEGQQFDMRGTVDEFMKSVGMYMFWKLGMDIYVSHVRHKQIHSYVFPECIMEELQTKLGRHLLLGEESLHQRAVMGSLGMILLKNLMLNLLRKQTRGKII